MNIEQFRHVLKQKWLKYYQENQNWLVHLGVWVTCKGQRRPSSGFILATLSILEPKLTQLLPLVVDLNNNPDGIVISLGLNFNPDKELTRIANQQKRLPNGFHTQKIGRSVANTASPITKHDETCVGIQQSSE